MPTISKKGLSMPQSPIRKLERVADLAVKNGRSIYHLNIGQPDIKTPEVAIEAIKNTNLEILAYSKSQGTVSFREKIAEYYKKHDIIVDTDDIIVTTGASEALMFVFGSIMDIGDEMIVPEPFYANYEAFAIASDAKIVPVVSKIEDNFALPPIETFEKLITPKTRAILICNPNNPTGYLYSKEEIEQLAAMVKKHDLYLIADEVYREFTYNNKKHYSIMEVPGLEEHAIMVDSVSKRYSMCGARIGCFVTKNKKVVETALKFAQARLSPPTLEQIASEAALSVPQSYYDNVLEEYRERRETLITELEKIENIKVAKPNGAFYCVVELPIKNSDNFAKWLLEDFHINNETVMIAPGAGFYTTPGLGLNQIRIAYVLNKERLIKAVHILKEALKVYKD